MQYIHEVIAAKDLNDKYGFPTSPYAMATKRKRPAKHLTEFGCPAIFKRYFINDKGKTKKNKHTQQGVRCISIRIPDDSVG